MPRLRWLTSREALKILGGFGFEVLTIPIHARLAVGTVRAIYRQAARLVPGDDLRSKFFSD